MQRRVLIMGAGGRDFHDFNTVFRDDPAVEVVAFTAAQIPGIDDRRYPPSLSGARYPAGIPIRPESELPELLDSLGVDEVVFAYSDVSHAQVMHAASLALAAGADFRLLGPAATMLPRSGNVPVVAVCANRTGAGKSQVSRFLARHFQSTGRRVALVRHPMPYGDLEAMRVQRFASLADIEASGATVEEREEYEQPVREGIVVFAGVDYGDVLTAARAEADLIVWDGGNNDYSFFEPDVIVTVVDALRPEQLDTHHPGETNVRMAQVVVVNKVDAAAGPDVERLLVALRKLNPTAEVVLAASPVTLEDGPELTGRRVLVVDDGPTLTHGGMAYGAGVVAARNAGAAVLVDPRPWAQGSLVDTFKRYPHLGPVLPAMGYGAAQSADLVATIRASRCDVVVTGTPIDLRRLGDLGHPVRHARYGYADAGRPGLIETVERRLAARRT